MLDSVWRAGLLFTAGATFTCVHRFMFLQRQARIESEHLELDVLLFKGNWWVAPIVGAVAAAIGLIWPFLESRVVHWKSSLPVPEWTGVLRCSAFFVGINHASAKIEFPSTFQLAVTLAALCCCLWWCFDRTISGMGAGLLIALVSALITYIYVVNFLNGDFTAEWQLWIPFLFFSGGVTMVIFGRLLASVPFGAFHFKKLHQE